MRLPLLGRQRCRKPARSRASKGATFSLQVVTLSPSCWLTTIGRRHRSLLKSLNRTDCWNPLVEKLKQGEHCDPSSDAS